MLNFPAATVDQAMLNRRPEAIQAAVSRIRESNGLAQATFSGQPLSLMKSLDRRNETRHTLEVPIYLQPVHTITSTGVVCSDHLTLAMTQDISETGLGMMFDEKLPELVVADFDLFGIGSERLLVEVRWSRIKARHAYVGGGLFLGVLTEAH